MAQYLGDLAEDATVTFWWNSNDGDGASITRSTNGTIKVDRDDGTDCTGTSVTDTEDDPDTGIHRCTIDTNDSANFTTGSDYAVWVDGAVIDGQTVNACLATFSIENRFMRGTDSAALASVCTEGRLAELDAANIPADVDSILLDTGTNGVVIGADAIGAANIADDAIGTDQVKADALDGVTNDDVTSAADVDNWRKKVSWLFQRFAHKTKLDATELVVRNAADDADVTAQAVADDGAEQTVDKIAD